MGQYIVGGFRLLQLYMDKFVIKTLDQTESNFSVSFQELQTFTSQGFHMNASITYYPYRHQIDDEGWGCAWRAIQTLLSTQQISLSFQTLYSEFSEKHKLITILQSKEKQLSQQAYQILDKSLWSPAQLDCHWAEPFIASIVCFSYHIPYQLILLNGQPASYAPLEVFQRVINFTQFLSIIKKVISTGGVMIDDGIFALSIIGIREVSPEQVQLLFADPHIKSNRLHRNVGLYSKTFNLEGKALSNNQSQIQKQESLYNVSQKLQFSNKNWMICFIDP